MSLINVPDTIREDLRGLELMWEYALDVAEDRDGWRICIALYAAQYGKD